MILRARIHSLVLCLWAACLVCVSLAASRVEDVILHLANGDRLSGTVVSESASELVLQTPSLGRVTIPLNQIQKREKKAAPPPPAKPTVEKPAPAEAPLPPAGALPPTSDKPGPMEKALAKATPKPADSTPKPKGPKRSNSEIQVGTNMRYATKDQQDYFTTFKNTFGIDRFKHILDYNFTYGKTEGVLSANKMTGSSKIEYNITKRWYAYNLGGAGYDEIRKIKLQYEMGPGMGYELLNLTNHALVVKSELGLTYQDQLRTDDSRLETYSLRLAKVFTWRIFDKLTADGRYEVFPNVEDFQEYRLRLETNLRYPLLKSLSLNLSVIDLYDTAAAPGVENNDLQIRSSLGFKF